MVASSRVTLDEMKAFVEREFPQLGQFGGQFTVEALEPRKISASFITEDKHLRPGRTVSGPVMMMLADVSIYLASFTHYGISPLIVTTSLNINFFSKPQPGKLMVEAKLMKTGKRLVVGESRFFAEGEEDLAFAHATATYSVPPEASA